MSVLIEDRATVLFQGDSITDAGRVPAEPTSLGCGYALMASAFFGMRHPAKGVRFLNRGISGNRVCDLVGRWQEDCIALRPTWVSIMIGINDTWRRYDSNDPTSAASYEADYRVILTRTRDELGARLILMEPFVLPHPEDRCAWREDLDPRIEIVHRLAGEFDAVVVPLDRIFNGKTGASAAYWAEDGVHPSLAGHALIAQSWLDAVGA